MNPTTTAAADRRTNTEQTPTTMTKSLAEIKQQELEQEVCSIYKQVAEEAPTASWHNRTVQVAARTGLSPEGIKKMLERNGINNPNKRPQQ